MNKNNTSRRTTLSALGAVSLLVSGLPSLASAACSANFSDYQVEVFSSTSGLAINPQTTVYPPNSAAGYNFKVLGGGAFVETVSGSAFLTGSFPDIDSSGPVGWIAESKGLGSGVQARVTAFVVAVNDPNNCWDVKAFQNATSTAVAHPTTSVSVGAGYVLTGGHGNFLFSSIPSNGGSGAYNAWSVHSKDHAVTDLANITAYAIGIKPAASGVNAPTLTVAPSRPSSPSNNPAAQSNGTATTQPGMNCTLTGGGANDDWGNGFGNLLSAIYPAGTGGWQAVGGWYASENAAVMTAYALCLN